MNKTHPVSDDCLVIDFQKGNHEVIAELVKRWHKKLCNKAYWLLKDKEVAKDVTQESWNIIIAKLGELKDPKSFGAWSSKIVYTKSIDHIHKQNKERKKQREYAMENSDFEQEENNYLLKEKLLFAIKELPYYQQNCIQLFYVENFSLKEISEIQNISVGTVKSRLFTAREKLKQLLKNKPYEN